MVLVTGATGIVGRVMVLELLKGGEKVRATKRATSDLNEVRKSFRYYTDHYQDYFDQIEWVDIDFEDLAILRKALDGVKQIYHCAGRVSFHPKDDARLYQTNVSASKNLLYIAEEVGVEKFLFISSIAVLDGTNEQGMMDETTHFNPKQNHSTYAITKHMAEMEVWRANAEGMNTVIVNPGVIIGSGNWEQSSGTIFSTFEKVPFTFSGGTGYIDVRDVASICIQLMDREFFGERFVLVSENKKFHQIGNEIRMHLGREPIPEIPPYLLVMGKWLNALLGWLIPPLRLLNSANIDALTTATPISNQKIKTLLDYSFIPISESIRFHIENYQKRQKDDASGLIRKTKK